MKRTRYDTLIEQVGLIQPFRLMEIGTWNGGTAERMIREALQHRASVEYYGFDLFVPAPAYEDPGSKIPPPIADVEARLTAIPGAAIHLVAGDTRETLKTFTGPGPDLTWMDLIWLDGGHSLDTIASDWSHCLRLMHPGTVVLFDDYRNDEHLGCRPLIQSLDPAQFVVEILEPMDVFRRPTGRLEVQIAKVLLNPLYCG